MASKNTYTVPASPAVLKWAREDIDMSLSEAARALHVPVETLKAFESGGVEPDLQTFRRMQRVYGRPESALLLRESPPPRPPVKDFRGRAGRKPSKQTIWAIRQAIDVQAFISDLVSEDDSILPRAELPTVAGLTAEQAATQIRADLGVTVAAQLSWEPQSPSYSAWRGVLQARGTLVLQQKMPWNDCRGVSLTGEGVVPTILVNTQDTFTGRLFTLFHEYAHLLRRTQAECIGGPEAEGNDEERWCDAFSAAFLMPEQALRLALAKQVQKRRPDQWTLGQIQSAAGKFRVSAYAMAWRLADLGISAYFHDHKGELWAGHFKKAETGGGGGTPREVEIVRDFGTAVAGALVSGLSRGSVTPSECWAFWGLPETRLTALATELAHQRRRERRT